MTAADWQRRPGAGRYARAEVERRFLLAGSPPTGRAHRRIEDRYLDGTRLRLRRVTGDGPPVHKLTQKVRVDAADPAAVSLTSVYLSAQEHALLSSLPGRALHKDRWLCTVGTHDVAVDDFRGRHEGLRLAEVEVVDLREPLVLPPWLGVEVTHDDRYSGGSLACADDEQVRRLLQRT